MKKGNHKRTSPSSKYFKLYKIIPVIGLFFMFSIFVSLNNLHSQTIIPIGDSQTYKTIETAYGTGILATISGAYIVELQTDYNPSGESYPITLAAKTGASSSNTITIRPAAGVSSTINITTNVTTQTFTFSGADYVIIDGRPGGTGTNKYITIENTSTNNSASTNTIQFINDATNNVIRYCTVKGSVTNGSAGSGTISFSTSTGTTGNDDNIIQYCDLTGGSSGRPFALISATTGTLGKENSGNIIEYNNFYDHFVAGATSNAIVTGQYNNSFIIRYNSFYQTTTLIPTAASLAYTHVNIGNYGIGYEISNNYFGGTSAECGGSALEIDGSAPQNPSYKAINMSLGASGTSTVQGNTIKNINVKSSNASMFAGITVSALLAGGTVNIGNVTGNTIGSSSGNGSIMLTSYSTAANTSYGIYLSGAGTINASNNTIGSITAANISASHPSSITAIYSGATSTQTINNNSIGSTSTSNSVYSSSVSSTPVVQAVRGIYCAGTTAAGTISGNTISNLTNAFTGTTANGGTYGIAVQSTGNYTLSNNTISYLYNASLNTAGDQTGPLVGIAFTATGTTAQTISGNTINNLYCTNTGSGAVKPAGIFISGPTTGTNNANGNFINNISISSSSTSAQVYGIRIGTGTINYYNNIIALGAGLDKDINIYGIFDNASTGTNNFYFNTVYISGSITGTPTKHSYAFNDENASNTTDIRNNIFSNVRTNTTGTARHYAIRLVNTVTTINYNDYYVSGTSGVLAVFNATPKATLIDWQASTTQDANSQNINPIFSDPDVNGNSAADFQPTNALLDGAGVTITGYTTDYSGYTRSNPPSIGGIEFNNPLPVTLSSFTYLVNGQNVKIMWITSSETNNSGFDIERKEFSGNWSKIGSIKGYGFSNTPKSYEFTDYKIVTGKYYYRLKQIDYNGNYETFDLNGIVEIGLPLKYKLSQNYPNPFNPVTKIDFELPYKSNVSLKLFDVSGREVMNVLNDNKEAGYYTLNINASHLSSGIYYYRITAISDNKIYSETRRMVLIK